MKPIFPDIVIGDWIVSPFLVSSTPFGVLEEGNRIFHKCSPMIAGYKGNRAYLADGGLAYLSDGKCCACKTEVPALVQLAARIM